MNQELERLAAWREAVHLELLSAAVEMIVSSTGNAEASRDLTRKLQRQPWHEDMDYTSFFEPVGLRYPGELLERYREKYGEERRHYRAVALALAFALPCVEDGMFIGSQRRNFMKQLQKDAKDDLYLQCALYQLEPSEQKALYERIMAKKHIDAAALLFALWFLPEDAFRRMSGQLDELLFQRRSLPLYGNSGVYAAFLQKYGEEIKASRNKSFTSFKALLALSSGYVRSGSKQDVLLQSFGFTRHEILYLNAALQWEDTLPGTLSLHGIPAEKMAVEYVILTLNASAAQDENAILLVRKLMIKYSNFPIKIEGHSGLWNAVQYRLHPDCPETIAWMCQNIQPTFDYHFDVLDDRYDVLHTLTPPQKYHSLFRRQLARQPQPERAVLEQMLERYEKLTGTSYLNAFKNYDWEERDAFNTLAAAGILSMSDYFTEHQAEIPKGHYSDTCLNYVFSYAQHVSSRAAFAFWQWFFERHSVQDVAKYFGGSARFDKELIRENRHFYNRPAYELNIARIFLTLEEQRQIYEWAEESFFCFSPGSYPAFQAQMLSDELVQTMYSQEELRQTFDALLATSPRSVNESLRQLYYTAEEKQRAAEAEVQRKEQERQAELQRIIEKWQEKIASEFDGSMTSAASIVDSAWRDKKLLAQELLPHILPRLEACGYRMPDVEIAAFLKLCGFFIQQIPDVFAALQSAIGKLQEVKEDDGGTTAVSAQGT